MKFYSSVYNVGYPVYGAKFLSNAMLLVAGGGGEGNNGIPNKLTVLRIDFEKKKIIKRFREITLDSNDDSPTTLDVASNTILMGCNENSERIKSGEGNHHLRKFVYENEHLRFVASIDFDGSTTPEDYTKLIYLSRDGTVGAIASSKVPTVIRIIDPRDLTEKYEIETGHDVKDMHFAPDGKVIGYITSATLEIISIVTGRFIIRMTDFDKNLVLSKIRFATDNTVIIAASLKNGNGIVMIKISLKSGTATVLKSKTITNKFKGVTSMDVDAKNQLAVLAGNDNSIAIVKLKDLSLGKLFKQVHSFAITRVTFSPDSQLIASVSAANTVHVIKLPQNYALSTSIWTRLWTIFTNFVLIVLIGIIGHYCHKYDVHNKTFDFLKHQYVTRWNKNITAGDIFEQTTLVGEVGDFITSSSAPNFSSNSQMLTWTKGGSITASATKNISVGNSEILSAIATSQTTTSSFEAHSTQLMTTTNSHVESNDIEESKLSIKEPSSSYSHEHQITATEPFTQDIFTTITNTLPYTKKTSMYVSGSQYKASVSSSNFMDTTFSKTSTEIDSLETGEDVFTSSATFSPVDSAIFISDVVSSTMVSSFPLETITPTSDSKVKVSTVDSAEEIISEEKTTGPAEDIVPSISSEGVEAEISSTMISISQASSSSYYENSSTFKDDTSFMSIYTTSPFSSSISAKTIATEIPSSVNVADSPVEESSPSITSKATDSNSKISEHSKFTTSGHIASAEDKFTASQSLGHTVNVSEIPQDATLIYSREEELYEYQSTFSSSAVSLDEDFLEGSGPSASLQSQILSNSQPTVSTISVSAASPSLSAPAVKSHDIEIKLSVDRVPTSSLSIINSDIKSGSSLSEKSGTSLTERKFDSFMSTPTENMISRAPTTEEPAPEEFVPPETGKQANKQLERAENIENSLPQVSIDLQESMTEDTVNFDTSTETIEQVTEVEAKESSQLNPLSSSRISETLLADDISILTPDVAENMDDEIESAEQMPSPGTAEETTYGELHDEL